MGLDMYLEAELYIGGEYEHRNATGGADITVRDNHWQLDATEISKIVSPCGYWRKANAIHQWFVNHIQDGKDECQRSWVSRDQLRLLKTLAQEVLDNKDEAGNLLPPASGFFFGSTDVDEWYFKDMEETVKILDKALAMPDEYEFYYQASW